MAGLRLLAVAVLALGAACAAPAPPPLPTCAPFSTKGGQPVECVLELYAGYTYVIFTACDSVKGVRRRRTRSFCTPRQLTLRPRFRTPAWCCAPRPARTSPSMTASLVRALQEVGACASLLTPAPLSTVCPGDASASLVEFYVECDFYGGASAPFTLLADCFRETDCSGQVVVEYSGKQEPVICSSPPPPPPTRAPTPPPRAPTGPFVCTRQDATCAALGDLYYAANGARWRSNDGWNDAASGVATDYCTFEWVSCDGGVLTNLCVRQPKPRALRAPSKAERLRSAVRRLGDNLLTGSLPDSLGQLGEGMLFLCVSVRLGFSFRAEVHSALQDSQRERPHRNCASQPGHAD